MEQALATAIATELSPDIISTIARQEGIVGNRDSLPLLLARAYLSGGIDSPYITPLLPTARRHYELAIANSVPVTTAPQTASNLVTGPFGSASNPYSRLTDRMLRIVARSLELDLDNVPRQPLLDILRDAPPPPSSSVANLLYEAAFIMGLDFTRDPYGQLSLMESIELIIFIMRADKATASRTTQPYILYLAALYLYPAYEPDLLTDGQIRDLFQGGRPTPSRKARQRRTKLLDLPADIVHLYLELYDTKWLHFVITEYPRAIEKYIDHIPQDYQQVVEALGIIVPPNRQAREYLMANIAQYELAVSQPSTSSMDQRLLQDRHNASIYLTHYSDRDMISLLGIVPHYNSRIQLINALANLLGGNPSFFFPIIRRCRNAETFYTNLTNDTNVDLIAYGTYDDYICYEPEELLVNVHERFISFPGTTDMMDREQLRQLRDLVELYSRVNSVYRRLLDKIKGILDTGNISMPELRAMLAQLDDWVKDAIRNFLLSIFRTGMYMRRWTGSGCYPVTEQQTLTGVNPEPLSIQGLIQSKSLYDNLPLNAKVIVNSLQAIGTNYMFIDRFNIVLQGEGTDNVHSCIRMSSNTFVRTAYHYLDGLFDYRIPDFDISRLASIS